MTGIYVHIPFCIKKCLYCSFYSQTDLKLSRSYCERLLEETKEYPETAVDSVYFGGGTPTCIETEYLINVITAIKEHFNVCGNSEITIEANPKTIDEYKAEKLLRAGFNRVSIGIQSLCDTELAALGRIHSAADGKRAVNAVKSAGFDNISVDVMTAIPCQTMESLKNTLDGLLLLPITHVSAYSLSIEEGTPFSQMKLALPDEDTEREMYHFMRKMLIRNGFEHYEISNFAKAGARARHNVKYWTGEPYIGLGAGAHSYFADERYSNPDDICKYMSQQSSEREKQKIDSDEKEREHIMLGLRMADGILCGRDTKSLEQKGLLHREGKNIRLTEKGLDYANYVITELL